MSRVAVVIPASGSGSRMGGVSKPFLMLGGQPLLQRTLQPFLARQDVVQIITALPGDVLHRLPDWLRAPRITTVAGGAERSESVRLALTEVADDIDIVIIHDAARPLCADALLQRVLDATSTDTAAIAALPASDTMHEVDGDKTIIQTHDRGRLWRAQTPQAFPRDMIVSAHDRAARDGLRTTDDAALVVHYGGKVAVVPGDERNLKITVLEDVALAEVLLAQSAP